jgi:hypothetical protein
MTMGKRFGGSVESIAGLRDLAKELVGIVGE